MDLDNLMLKREHFPVKEFDNYFTAIYLPPCHPSMKENGIDADLVVAVLEQSILDTIKDYEGRYWTQNGSRRSLASGWRKSVSDDSRILVKPFPTESGELIIGKDEICPRYGEYFTIRDDPKASHRVILPKGVPQELIDEYELIDDGPWSKGEKIMFECERVWTHRGVGPHDRVLLKNLVIAIGNEIVRRKYS